MNSSFHLTVIKIRFESDANYIITATPARKKHLREQVLFSIQSEGLVCNQRAPRVACNPSLRDGMASRFSAYSRFSAFGLIPYMTS